MRMLVSERLSENRFKTPEGFLYCRNCVLSRTGKQEYMKCELYPDCTDDSIVEVDRTEDEVFSDKALSSFENKPLCLNHPDENVGPENYSQLAIGHVNNIRRGKYQGQDVMIGDILITDPDAIEMVESGEIHDLSCGYDCDLTTDENPRQINIRGNHVALCPEGRAGCARIVDNKTITDSVGKGSLIQEFGKQGKQYKVSKIEKNVIYAEELGSGKVVLFHKDKEGEEWASITKAEVKDSNTTIEDSENKAGKYYYILAKTRGMFGPASAVLKEQGEELYFINKSDRDAYLQKIRDNESPINNFNSYFPKETEEDFEPGKNTKVIKSLSETSYMKDSKIKDAHISLNYFNPSQSSDKEFLNEIAKKYNCSVREINHTLTYNEVVFEGTRDNLFKLATGEEFDIDKEKAWTDIIDYKIKPKDATSADLKPEIIDAIKSVLGEQVNIEYGTRGIGNIVIRFKEEVKSPYMQNASLQGVMLALEKLQIKVDKSRSMVNRYMMEIVTNVESSNELTKDCGVKDSISDILKEKGFEYIEDDSLGLSLDKSVEIWRYVGTGHFNEVVEKLVNEYPHLIRYRSKYNEIIVVNKSNTTTDSDEYSDKFYHKAINEMEKQKEDLKKEDAPDENRAEYIKHKEELNRTLSNNIKRYKRKIKEDK